MQLNCPANYVLSRDNRHRERWLNNRGVIPAVYILILAGIAVVALMPHWGLPSFLQKRPPTAELAKAQQDLAAARAAQAAAQAQLEAAKAEEARKTETQTRYAQQMVAGVPLALAKAPQGPEVILASQLAQRAQMGLAAAIGDLPADKQAEITQIVEQVLSTKEAEITAAKAELAQVDAQLANVTEAKKGLDRQIPILQSTLADKETELKVKDAAVQTETAAVAQWAQKKAASDARAGSLSAYADNLFRILLIAGILYLAVHFVLPSLAAEFPSSTLLSKIYRSATSIFSAHSILIPKP